MGSCFGRKSRPALPAPPEPDPQTAGPAVMYQPQVIAAVPPVMFYQPPLMYQAPPPPVVLPQQHMEVQWIKTTTREAIGLSDRAVIGGYKGNPNLQLWVIRAEHAEGDIIPGSLDINNQAAFVPWCGEEWAVEDIEVCCAPPQIIQWVDSRDGVIPPRAIQGGITITGEALYVARANIQGSVIPGKVHPSHKGAYISYAGEELNFKTNYQTMCYA